MYNGFDCFMKCTYRVYVSLARFFMVLSLWEISSEFISGILLFPMDMPFSVIYFKIQVDHCVSTYVYMAMSQSPVFFSIAMSQSPILPQLRLGWSSPKRSLCSLPRSAAPSSRNPGIQNIGRKPMDGLASRSTLTVILMTKWMLTMTVPVPVIAWKSWSSISINSSSAIEPWINADWCWLILIDADWCWLMLIDSDWCWLILIDADWCWLQLIGVEWCWLILIEADCSRCRLLLIGADWCWFWLVMIDSYWCL